jgi:hypothetical protein
MKFSQWLKENGSINQSMPELEKDQVPTGSMVTSEPFSELDKRSILNKEFLITAKEDGGAKELIMKHPGRWLVQKVSNKYLKAKNVIDNYQAVFLINKINLF